MSERENIFSEATDLLILAAQIRRANPKATNEEVVDMVFNLKRDKSTGTSITPLFQNKPNSSGYQKEEKASQKPLTDGECQTLARKFAVLLKSNNTMEAKRLLKDNPEFSALLYSEYITRFPSKYEGNDPDVVDSPGWRFIKNNPTK